MKILVTGATGLVGSACVELFENMDWEVIGVDNDARAKNLKTTSKKRKGIFKLDITKEHSMHKLFERHKFDAIIHAAAQPSHDFSNNNVLLDFDTNARATVILLEQTRKYSPDAVFVYVSTDKVYGERMNPEHLEETETRYESRKPFDEYLGLDYAGHRSPFGCSKAAGDMYVQEYAKTFGLKTGIFRPGCITGRNHEGAELHGFLAYLVKCIRTGTTYKIFGYGGKQVRDQIHARDLAAALYEFVKNPHSGEVYNIGGGTERSLSVIEAIDYIQKITGLVAKYEFHEKRPGDRVWDVHDVSKFRTHYPNWDYVYSLEKIISDVCEKKL